MDLSPRKRELLVGKVFLKKNGWGYTKKRYAVACTGREPMGVETASSEDRQAHLLLYKVKSSDSDIITERINFSTVLGVSAGPSGITLRLPDSFPADFKFRAKRSSVNKLWMEVCTLLNAFPNYSIPKSPEAHKSLLRPELANLSRQYYEMYDAYDAWTVHVLPDSVATAWNIVGLQVVAIGRGDNMLKIIDLAAGTTRLKMARHEILRCGFWESMLCLEVSVGMRGVLWMDCFKDQVKHIRDKIHNFAFYGIDGKLPMMPHFPSFYSDLPFSPRCYFEISQRSRSNSRSSQGSDKSDTVSCSLELKGPPADASLPDPPQVNLTGHPSFVPIKLVTPSTKYLAHSPVDHKKQPEMVLRDKKRRSILLESNNSSDRASPIPQGYTEPISTRSHVSTSTHKDYQPMEYCTPVSRAEQYVRMHANNLSSI